LCFGVLWDDGDVVPHPPVRRGLELTREILVRAGHKGELPPRANVCLSGLSVLSVIDWEPFRHSEIGETAVRTRYHYSHSLTNLARVAQNMECSRGCRIGRHYRAFRGTDYCHDVSRGRKS
jgi:hypothetical protein